jgi:hypothetical protein
MRREEGSHSLQRLKLWTLMESDEEGGGFTKSLETQTVDFNGI